MPVDSKLTRHYYHLRQDAARAQMVKLPNLEELVPGRAGCREGAVEK